MSKHHRRSRLIESLETGTLLAMNLPAGFVETPIASGIGGVTAMDIAPDGRVFISAEAGQLRIVQNGALVADPFLTVTTNTEGERGLLGIALDPEFESNGYIYCYYTATTPALHNRVSRFTADPANPNKVLAGSELPLIDLPNLGAIYHNGGSLQFGPDGKLYIGTGDNTVTANSQTLNSTLGKILRINKNGSIPNDNPFYNEPNVTGDNKAIWALGLRNPFTIAFQPGTNRMIINDVGQDNWEEIDEGIAGSNYGWPYSEGFKQAGNQNTTIGTYRDPLHAYNHSIGECIIGGVFYNPVHQMFPDSRVGDYFFMDDIDNWMKTMETPGSAVSDFGTNSSSPVDLRFAPDGSIYVLARGGNGTLSAIRYTSVQGTVFNDSNSNGVKDEGEAGLNDWFVYDDLNNNGAFNAGEPSDTTDSTGLYVIGGLNSGTHNIRQVLPAGYRKTAPGSGQSSHSVALATGQASLGKDFGNTSNILLAGTVYNDANQNGVRDGGEVGLSGMVVTIFAGDTSVAVRTTDANGFWRVQGLSAGTGSAELSILEGWAGTAPANGIYTGSMTAGQANQNLNFGLRPLFAAPVLLGSAAVLTSDLISLNFFDM